VVGFEEVWSIPGHSRKTTVYRLATVPKRFPLDAKSFKNGKVEFFARNSNYMDVQQLNWLNRQLQDSNSARKICYFHHPLYSEGKFHGPDADLRQLLEPILETYGVNVVFSGHKHVYERIKPLHGIYYFVLGNSGQLRSHNLKRSAEIAKGFDTDRTFMLIEIARIALAEAERRGLATRSRDVRIARREIANNHGFMTWDLLLDSGPGRNASRLLKIR
jgi:hypothetical protein